VCLLADASAKNPIGAALVGPCAQARIEHLCAAPKSSVCGGPGITPGGAKKPSVPLLYLMSDCVNRVRLTSSESMRRTAKQPDDTFLA
jgi:hypothetical protein